MTSGISRRRSRYPGPRLVVLLQLTVSLAVVIVVPLKNTIEGPTPAHIGYGPPTGLRLCRRFWQRQQGRLARRELPATWSTGWPKSWAPWSIIALQATRRRSQQRAGEVQRGLCPIRAPRGVDLSGRGARALVPLGVCVSMSSRIMRSRLRSSASPRHGPPALEQTAALGRWMENVLLCLLLPLSPTELEPRRRPGRVLNLRVRRCVSLFVVHEYILPLCLPGPEHTLHDCRHAPYSTVPKYDCGNTIKGF